MNNESSKSEKRGRRVRKQSLGEERKQGWLGTKTRQEEEGVVEEGEEGKSETRKKSTAAA